MPEVKSVHGLRMPVMMYTLPVHDDVRCSDFYIAASIGNYYYYYYYYDVCDCCDVGIGYVLVVMVYSIYYSMCSRCCECLGSCMKY